MPCTLCPRACGADRENAPGFCGARSIPLVARAALHFGEEPCFGSPVGAVFFSGCALKCVFCQNRAITNGKRGKEVSVTRLSEIYLELQDQGASALDLVTGSHFAPAIAESLNLVKNKLTIPVIWNCSGYESPEILALLRGKIDIYLPDFKFGTSEFSVRYASAPDYPEIALNAIKLMYASAGDPAYDQTGKLLSGVAVRHLVLPGGVEDSLAVLERLHRAFPDKRAILLSLMRQYTPVGKQTPPLNRRVTTLEYEKVLCAAREYGFSGFSQDRSSATSAAIPAFDNTGV